MAKRNLHSETKSSKVCYRCNIERDISKFYKSKKHLSGVDNVCSECCRKRFRKYKEKDPLNLILIRIRSRCKDKTSYIKKGIKCLLSREDIEFLWNRDEAHLLKKPSIDRIDNKGHYTIDNCQFIEMSENSVKDRYRPIIQYDLDGNFIAEHESATHVAKKIGCHKMTITLVAMGINKTGKGFIWKYKD